MDCYSCKSISGEKRISPGPTIFESKYWLVEHAYPVNLEGWLVLVLKRHAEALHELSAEEWSELPALMEKTTKALHKTLKCEKEYAMCLAEAEHFNHIHFHIIPKPHDFPDEFKGTKIFALLKVTPENSTSPKKVQELCERLKLNF